MKFKTFLIGLLFLGIPALAHGQILISEIAWMGTDQDSAHEWIEIYNFDTTPANLAGWTLTSDDGNLSVTLAGILPPHGVVLLERGSDNTVPGVNAILTYDGEMSDAGTTLTIKDPQGTISDQAIGGNNWSGIGGVSTAPKKTAQRTRMGTWVTAAATPALDNAQVNDPTPPGEVAGTSTNSGTSNRSSGGSSKKINKLSASIKASSTAYVGKPIVFNASLSGLNKTRLQSFNYFWNFGDMNVSEEVNPSHIFEFPGEYVVVVEASSKNNQITARHDIRVVPHALTLSITQDGDAVIANKNAEEFNLDGYVLRGEGFQFIFPRNSILKSDASITLSHTRLSNMKSITLADSARTDITTLNLSAVK